MTEESYQVLRKYRKLGRWNAKCGNSDLGAIRYYQKQQVIKLLVSVFATGFWLSFVFFVDAAASPWIRFAVVILLHIVASYYFIKEYYRIEQCRSELEEHLCESESILTSEEVRDIYDDMAKNPEYGS